MTIAAITATPIASASVIRYRGDIKAGYFPYTVNLSGNWRPTHRVTASPATPDDCGVTNGRGDTVTIYCIKTSGPELNDSFHSLFVEAKSHRQYCGYLAVNGYSGGIVVVHSHWHKRSQLLVNIQLYKADRYIVVHGTFHHEVTAVDRSGLVSIIKSIHLLLHTNASVDVDTTLTYTVKNHRFTEVRHLLRLGANPNERDVHGRSVLAIACENRDSRVAGLLIDGGANVDEVDITSNRATPLLAASNMACLPCIKLLIAHRARVELADKSGITPLIASCLSTMPHATGCAEFLVNHGARVNAQDSPGSTPLIAATLWHYVELVRFLIAHGADPNVKDVNGNSALSIARRDKAANITAILSKAGAKKLRRKNRLVDHVVTLRHVERSARPRRVAAASFTRRCSSYSREYVGKDDDCPR